MSKSMLANPKAALGFAGVVIVLAIAASFGAGAFLTEAEPREEPIAAAEEENANVATNAPAPAPQAAWGGGSLSDSWSSSAPASGMSSRQDNSAPDEPSPTFGDYSASASEAGPAISQRAQRPSSKGPKITSGPAPGAPPVKTNNPNVPGIVRQ